MKHACAPKMKFVGQGIQKLVQTGRMRLNALPFITPLKLMMVLLVVVVKWLLVSN